MANLNKVLLIGNLTRDPEIKFIATGSAVCELRMAISRRFRTAAGEEKEDVCYVDVTVWGKQAESCEKYLKRGSPVFVEGRLAFDEWEKEGQKHSKLRVTAERVQFLSAGPGRRESGEGGEHSQEPRPERRPETQAAAPRSAARGTAETTAAEGAADEDDLPF